MTFSFVFLCTRNRIVSYPFVSRSKYYGENAIVLDGELSTQLPVLAGKLTAIFFALTIDKPSLDTDKPSAGTGTGIIASLVAGSSSISPSTASQTQSASPNPNSSAIAVPVPAGGRGLTSQFQRTPAPAVAASVPSSVALVPNGTLATSIPTHSIPVPVSVSANTSFSSQQQSSDRGVSTYGVSLASSACSNSFLLTGSPPAQQTQAARPPRVQRVVSFGDGDPDPDTSGDADALEHSTSTADSGVGPAHKSPTAPAIGDADPSSLSSSNKSNSNCAERTASDSHDSSRILKHSSSSVPYRMDARSEVNGVGGGGGVDSGSEADHPDAGPELQPSVAQLKSRLLSGESSQQLSASAPRLTESPLSSVLLTPHSNSTLYASPAQSSHGSQEGLLGDSDAAAETEQQAALARTKGASLAPLAPGALAGSVTVIPIGSGASSLSPAATRTVEELEEDAEDVVHERSVSGPLHGPELSSSSVSSGTLVEAAAGRQEMVASAAGTAVLAPVMMRSSERPLSYGSGSGSARESTNSSGSGSGPASIAFANEPALTNKELKQALVNLVQKKDTLELRIQTLLNDISAKSDAILTLEVHTYEDEHWNFNEQFESELF